VGQVVTMGLDIAKSVFQVCGVDTKGAVVIWRKFTRARLLSFRVRKLSARLDGE
jgi:transposase